MPVATSGRSGWLVAATTLTSHRRLTALPTGAYSPVCSTRNSLACRASDMSATSSRNSVPPLAASNIPTRFSVAPVKAPRRVAEQLRLEQGL